jgi:hypothetical protein
MASMLRRGRVSRERHSAAGDLALLVLVDSGGAYHARSIVEETVLVALEHWGLPYRLLDLAVERPTVEALAGCAGLVVAQDGVGGRLNAAETRLIADAVAAGMGLVNLDWDLRQWAAPLWEVFGFEEVERLPIASNVLRVMGNDHYITWQQEAGALHRSQRMVTALVVRGWGEAVRPLVEVALGKDQLVYMRHLVPGNAWEPGHYPVVFAGRWGQGKAVQWAVNPRLWRAGAWGHLRGLDDVLWRSVLWAARKPLVANAMPPLVTMSFDDCSGRHDFQYLEVCNRHGYTPLASLFIDTVKDKHLPLLRGLASDGKILVNTHGFDYYDLQLYDFGMGEFTPAQLEERFARESAFYAKLGAQPCRTIRHHWGEDGFRALPFLKDRGRTFICTPFHIGEHKADQYCHGDGRYPVPAGEGYWPYDMVQCFYDFLPDDNDFYIFGSFGERHLADFMTGATLWLQESPTNDLEKVARQGAAQLRHGLANGFYAEFLTHEAKLGVLDLASWDAILRRIAALTDRLEMITSDHDAIGAYLRDKDRTRIVRAERAGGGFGCQLVGQAAGSLKLSVYKDVGDGVERRYLTLGAFDGQAAIQAPAS